MKITTDKQVQELQLIWQRELGIAEIRAFQAPIGTDKEHFLGYLTEQKEPHCFIKVTKKQMGYAQELAASQAMVRLGYLTQTVLGSGEIEGTGGSIYWIAFPWLACKTVHDPTDVEVQEIGRWIGQLHRLTTGLAVPGLRQVTLESELFRQLEKLKMVNPELADGLRQRYVRLRAEDTEWESYEQSLPRVMVHGDFGWRNVIRKADGELLMIDLEHAMLAPNWMDFGKAFDRNLHEPQRRAIFLAAYGQEMGQGLPEVRETYHNGMRLWQIAGIYNFTERAGDETGFRAHADRVLQAVDQRWPL